MEDRTAKIIGWAITAIGLATSVAGSVFSEKQQQKKIDAAVAKAITDQHK